MEQSSQNRVRKFLSLLRTAQNEAFVGLVCDSLKIELKQKPWKIFRVLNYIFNDISKSNADFTRLKVSEGLIPAVLSSVTQDSLSKILDHYNALADPQKKKKLLDKFESSCLSLCLQSSLDNEIQEKMSYFTFDDMLLSNKNFFSDLIQKYQPLLCELNINQGSPVAQTKDNVKQIFMEGAMGVKAKTDKLKLSDFIEESFFDDIDDGMQQPIMNEAEKLPVTELITQLKDSASKKVIDTSSLSMKRAKTQAKNDNQSNKYVMLSPILAMIVQSLTKLFEDDWKLRQSSATILRIITSSAEWGMQLFYSTVKVDQEGNLVLSSPQQTEITPIVNAIIPQLLVLLVKDQFNDYEELKVLTPVREEAISLLITIQKIAQSKPQLYQIVQQLPMILKAVEVDKWTSKYNFFILIKGLLPSFSSEIFQMFNRVLIESLLNVEEEVLIIITDLISQLLPQYLQITGYEKWINCLLVNLQENLKKCDEIESSVISVFNLINKIIDSLPDLQAINFQADLNTFCPFNFHKIINVRYSYDQIINKCLQTLQFDYTQREILVRLILQSLTMERSKSLVRLLLNNMRIAVTKFNQSEFTQLIRLLFTKNQLFYMLFNYQITEFDNFIFFSSKNFEEIDNDYYKVVYKPENPDEIEQFYYGKMNNLTKGTAFMMSHSQFSCKEILNLLELSLLPPEDFDIHLQTPVHEAHFIYFLCISRLIKLNSQNHLLINIEDINRITEMFISSLSEEFISIDHFKALNHLQNLLNSLWNNCQRHNQQMILTNIQVLFQLMEQCYYQHKITGLPLIQQQLEFLMQGVSQLQHIAEIYECCSELSQVFTSLYSYGTTICNRVKSISAIIHIQLVQSQVIPLTSQLNNIIKPILNQVKSEKIEFIQKISCYYLVELMTLLFSKGKIKAAQQILSVLIKSLESQGFDPIQDKGSKLVLKRMIQKHQNILTAYNQNLFNYIISPLTSENLTSYVNAKSFLLSQIKEYQSSQTTEIYKEQASLASGQICTIIQLATSDSQLYQENSYQIPCLFKLFFDLFKSEQVKIITELIKAMESKAKVGFDCLRVLLDDTQSSDILKFIPVFIIPVIKNLQYSRIIYNDDKQITQLLASLLQLLPLNLAQIQSQEVDQQQELILKAQEGMNFLQIIVNNNMVTEYGIQIPVKATLRDYQKQGIAWLSTFGKYNMNCALCDDMGLGKTIQSLCVVLNESYLRKQGQDKECKTLNLIVCPTTITHNWLSEIKKFFNGFKAVVYEGSSQQKADIVKTPYNYDVIIVSYEKLRNDIKQFASHQFFYMILDEAHIIKNSKAKTTLAVKQINCEKKIALTGTPLQNKVSELWSIFDFLMPGFLEEESVFNKKYNQYLTSNIKKLSEKLEETQSFLNALKSLKKRIQPFILRRTKSDVLKELPPKIIQDVVCKMTSFQEYVHSQVEKHYPIQQQLQSCSQDSQPQKLGKSILQNLILHRKVCNHPMFVAPELQQNDKNIQKHLKEKNKSELMSYEGSGKLLGLYDKLVECEVIQKNINQDLKEEMKVSLNDNSELSTQNLLADMAQTTIDQQKRNGQGKHRVLIFCQMSSFLRMIVEQILQKFNINYLELLSSHSSKERVEIVENFNTDERIGVLILTTAVGGLGLNLTGADTVIFAEHDWNPMKDLQAIDRAHRIGQTRQVNVYRLIVQDTLEEKIMNLQRFKENLAKSLVQARGTTTEDASKLEVSDLINSFQEHSAFANEENRRKALQVEDKLVSNLEEIWQGGAFIEEL